MYLIPNSNILIKIFPYTSFYQKHFVVAREVSAICQVCLLFGKLAFRAQHGELGHSKRERKMLSGIQNIRVMSLLDIRHDILKRTFIVVLTHDLFVPNDSDDPLCVLCSTTSWPARMIVVMLRLCALTQIYQRLSLLGTSSRTFLVVTFTFVSKHLVHLIYWNPVICQTK